MSENTKDDNTKDNNKCTNELTIKNIVNCAIEQNNLDITKKWWHRVTISDFILFIFVINLSSYLVCVIIHKFEDLLLKNGISRPGITFYYILSTVLTCTLIYISNDSAPDALQYKVDNGELGAIGGLFVITIVFIGYAKYYSKKEPSGTE